MKKATTLTGAIWTLGALYETGFLPEIAGLEGRSESRIWDHVKYIVNRVTGLLCSRVESFVPYRLKGMFINGVSGELCCGLVFNILQFSKVYSDVYLCSWDEKQPEPPEAFVLFLDFTRRYSFHTFLPEGGSVSVSSLHFPLWCFGLPYYLLQFCLPSSNFGREYLLLHSLHVNFYPILRV